MKWYSPQDLTFGFDLTVCKIRHMIWKGELFAMYMLPQNCNIRQATVLVPETELCKLEQFRAGKPRFIEDHQPCEWLLPQEMLDSENRIYEIAGIRSPKRGWVGYQLYMQSPEWQEVRNKRLELDNWQCRRCGTAKNLRVHHISYEHLGEPEELGDVITLCDNCHHHVHKYDLDDIHA